MDSKLDKFASLFTDINFEIDIRESLEEQQQRPETRNKVKVELNRELQRAKSELATAKKLFKQGKLDHDQMIELEWRVFELKEQLDRLNEDYWGDELDELGGEG